jgi:hypothetical protein
VSRVPGFFRRQSLTDLVTTLPPLALLPLALAIISLFSMVGILTDLFAGARQPAAIVAANSLFGGVIGIGYAYAGVRRHFLGIAAAIATHLAYVKIISVALASLPPLPPEAIHERLANDATWMLLAMVASYSCFLWFINGTAATYLKVRAEIDLASQIHQVLVPRIAVTAGSFEFYGVSIASGEVGGDLVDVVNGDEGWIGYVADVSGHGVSSGVVMGMFKSALRMRLLHPGPLAALLNDLNTVLVPLKSGSMFVTTACVRGRDTGDLEYSVAGHLPILRVRAGAPAVEEITIPQIPIAMFDDYRFTSATLTCERGDLLALITDGLTEVFDARDEQLGIDPVKAILASGAGRPLAEVAEAIVAAARAHGAQIDDQTLLLIRRRSVTPGA